MTNGARKFDGGKPPVVTGFMWRWPRAIKEVAKVSAVGAEKYDVVLPDNNCLNVPDGYNRYANAIGRHLLDMAIDGPMNIEKGGSLPPEGREVYHLAQMIWDGLTVLERYLIDQEAETRKTAVVEAQQKEIARGPLTTSDPRQLFLDSLDQTPEASERSLPTIDWSRSEKEPSVPTGNVGRFRAT